MEHNDFYVSPQLKDVRIKDPFWQRYISLVKNEVLPYQLLALNDGIDGAPKSHCLDNFKKAAKTVKKIKNGEAVPVYPVDKWEYNENNSDENSFLGWCFQDTDIYKWLEAAGYQLALCRDDELRAQADGIIDLICSAQLDNGYLDTLYIINDRDKIFTNLKDRHELYCFGHLTQAGIAYYNATGNDKLLCAAQKFADLICETFGVEENKKKGYPGHELAELALVELYRQTGAEKYLDAADFFISQRGKKPYYFDAERGYNRTDGSSDYFYNQAHIEPVLQTEAVGHAVRGVYLYTGMAMLAKEREDEALFAACKKIWRSIADRKLYITGGIGATADGEAFSFDYDLPNDTAYCETCASIGLAFFARAMLELEPSAEYADVTERAVYNTILSGISQDGKSFFYVNPLEVLLEACAKDSAKRHVKPTRQKWYGCACCPPNLARFISSIGKYICSESSDVLYIHLYIGAAVEAENARLDIDSDYLGGGSVTVRVEPKKPFALALRIPDWCKSFTVNVPYKMRGGYAFAQIDGKTEIKIHFDIKPRFVRCSNRVRQNAGKAAVARGPVVYCAEGADNGSSLHLLSLNVAKEPQYNPDGSITVGGYREKDDGDRLYFDCVPSEKTPCDIRFIPYHSWGNRGENEMQIYFPVDKI